MTTKYPRDPDSTIRILKAFYKMGDLNAMKEYIDLWDLAGAVKTDDQEAEASQLEGLIGDMEAFEKVHGRGSCLQLAHPAVMEVIMRKDHYPQDVLLNARAADWMPVAYDGWEYPRLVARNAEVSLKAS